MRYHLVTTADERTWKFDRPTLFLGEWCRQYARKHIWKEMDAVVAAPYGLRQAQRDADLTEARQLEEKLFPILSDRLNEYHGTRHAQRFWRIVLGHWLRRYTEAILNRVRTIESCLCTYQLSGTTGFANEMYSLAPLDSNASIWAFSDDRWNNALYIRILNLLTVPSPSIELIVGDSAEGFRLPLTATEANPNATRSVREQLGKVARYLASDTDALIVNTYLPRKEAIKLHLSFGQIPQQWGPNQPSLTKMPDLKLRARLSDLVDKAPSGSMFAIMASLLFELLPVCYLEGFTELREHVQQLPYPETPKFIFASNNFVTDELFKVWVATKTEAGVPYIVGQHGNNYGTYRYSNPSIEESTADKFLTWGWAGDLPQHTPAFIFKTAGQKDECHAAVGGLLLIELSPNHRITTWDSTFEFGDYLEDQQGFIEALQPRSREQLTVRLHSEYRYKRGDEELLWRDFDPSLRIEFGVLPIRQLISQSRLVVHSYDSTGILEMLAGKVPMLAFWQHGLNHLRDSAKPYYQLLVEAGIVHLSAESAAFKVNEVWDDAQRWWSQRAVLKARRTFVERYARVEPRPAWTLRKLLLA
jgi:putative transferase (TIGR04331 family)